MRKTIKERRAAQQLELTNKVIAMTGLTTDQVNNMIFNHGMEYMEQLGEPSIVQSFTSEPIYWAWWRQQWALIDASFIRDYANEDMPVAHLAHHYEMMHREVDTFPEECVWKQIHADYEKMSQRVIRNQKHKSDAKS